MKTIGLLGGMSWESTELYYRWINEGVKKRLGGLHSARIAIVSVDFQEIERLQHDGNWPRAGEYLAHAAKQVQSAGADFLLICTNTMHKVADAIEQTITIPILHLADATALKVKEQGINTVGLLGTAFTMEQDFYKGRLSDMHGLEVVIPGEKDRKLIHDVIYNELCLGVVKDSSREEYLRVIQRLQQRGAECVVAGCTEITMLVQQWHTDVLLFDTTAIHAEAAVDRALA